MSFLQPHHQLPEHLLLEIASYLSHTGPLACTCKSGRDLAVKTHGPQKVCCPVQQFYHPEDAELQWDDSEFDQFPDYPFEERETLVDHFPPRHPGQVWSCCGSHENSTGCMHRDDCIDDDQVEAAIQANEETRYPTYSEEDDMEVDRDWDDSVFGDAKRWCRCGYADGVYTYCIC